jgi:hypothetical protein
MGIRAKLAAVAAAITIIGAGASVAHADNVEADGDGTTPVVNQALALGTVCTGSTTADTALVAISRNGNYPSTNVFKLSTAATVSVQSVTGAGLSASVASPATIAIPGNWDTVPNNTMTPAVTSNVTFVAGATPGAFTGTVTYRSTGLRSADGTILTREQAMTVTATVVSCNAPPTITVNAVTLEGNALGGRVLSLSDIGSATDVEDVTPAVACTPALGSVLPLGANNVSCTATDSGGKTATDSGMVTVVDTTPPSITGMPASATIEATSASGAAFTYVSPSANDVVWGAVAVTCAPASGSTFSIGANPVTCTAQDGSHNIATAQFSVNVQDTTAPIITPPAIDPVEGNTLGGAFVTFAPPTATDIVDGSTPVTCNKSSGDFFPLGATTVICQSSDQAGNTNSAAFVVTVVDTTAPTITTSDITVEGNATGGANVTFATPTATDIVDGNTAVTCDKVSGDFFPLGVSPVTCNSTDASGNPATATFYITVKDTTAPSLVSMPTDVTVEGNTLGGSQFAYTDPTATDIVDANPSVSCTPDPGFFALGSTTVTCIAADGSGNTTSQSFIVTVQDTTAPVITLQSRTPAANSSGWNNTDVTLTWLCSDVVSGVGTTTSTVTTEGANQSSTGVCVDGSGNQASHTVTGINIDKTAPTLGISGAASGAYAACSIPGRPSFAPADGLSGIAPTPNDGWVSPGTPSGVGTYTYTATATDLAGNSASETRTYTVTYGAAFGGFLQPINNDGTSRFKMGSTVPVKFQLMCGGVPVTNAVVKLMVKKEDANPNPGIDEAISTAASTTGNLFRYSDPQYIFNMNTKAGYTNPGSSTPISFTQGTWTVSALLDDGTWRSVNIQLVK